MDCSHVVYIISRSFERVPLMHAPACCFSFLSFLFTLWFFLVLCVLYSHLVGGDSQKLALFRPRGVVSHRRPHSSPIQRLPLKSSLRINRAYRLLCITCPTIHPRRLHRVMSVGRANRRHTSSFFARKIQSRQSPRRVHPRRHRNPHRRLLSRRIILLNRHIFAGVVRRFWRLH